MDNKKIDPIELSVCMITFNQEHYIQEAIEGVIMQKCNFNFELIIGDDCSTDNTRSFCEDFVSKYNNINLITSNINLGITSNFVRTLQVCNGKYVALCEGDDYWIDPYKLQKQVDFLEANPECILVHTNGYIKKNNKLIPWHEWDILEGDVQQTFYYGPSVRTCTALLRAEPLLEYLNLLNFSNIKIIGDWPIFAYYSTKGKFGYLRDKMSVYRINSNSITSRKLLINYFNYSKDVIEVKRFLRDYIFTGRLDDLYSEPKLLKELNHIHLKHSFDTWNYKESKKYAERKDLNLKSRRLAIFTKNFFLFIIGCSFKSIKQIFK